MSGFFRYPGGKAKIRQIIIKHLELYDNDNLEYREPFFGGGGIGLSFLKTNPTFRKIWINDYDIGIAAIWNSVINHPEDLKLKIRSFTPTVQSFFKYKEELSCAVCTSINNTIDIGFKKLAVHQMSYSGLGVRAGGPIGGVSQKSKYKVDCRWSPDYMCKKIDSLHLLLHSFDIKNDKCTWLDFYYMIKPEGKSVLLYLDPPYYVKGSELYQKSFDYADHLRLCEYLKETQNHWILSYDDHPYIRELYAWAHIETINVKYTIRQTKTGNEHKSNTKPELLIYPDTHKKLLDERPILSK